VAGLLGDTLYLAQVGDSRAYVIRNGEAMQITKDQSLMQRLVEAGELTQEEAERSERRNIILQALGPEPTVRIDLTHQQLRQNDILVLCTDGLSGLVKKEEIAEVVTGTDDLVEACRQLIDRANENGGPDNITAIVAKMEGTGLQASGSADKVGHAVYALPGSTPQGGIPREEAPTAPTFRRASPAPLPNSATSAAQNVTDERPIQTSSGAMDTRRAVITALAATLALLGLFLLARQLRGTGPHAAAAPVTAPSTVDTTDTAAHTKKP
jgi:protein phosphatase